MEIVIYLIPFIVSLFLLIFFRKETVWFEYLLLIIPTIIIFLLTRLIVVSANETDIEYLGDYITKVRHYDEWDEWIEQTCSREVPSGTDSDGNTIYTTEYYDCSYRQYHPERWTYFDQDGEEHWLFFEKEFNEIAAKFGTRKVFVDMKRDYYRIDGDAQDVYWNKTEKTAWTLTHSHKYKNKVQRSRSVFNFEDISDEEADSLGLYQYPEIGEYDQVPILSNHEISKEQIDAVKFTNAYYGKKHQFRTYILLFEDEDIEISELQRSYWKGGNKNELVVCLGIDSTKVKWCNAFSWCDVPTLDIKTESYFVENDTLDLVSYTHMIRESLEKGEWDRKKFADFDYIKSEMSSSQELFCLILILIYNIGMSVFIICNKIRNNITDFV